MFKVMQNEFSAKSADSDKLSQTLTSGQGLQFALTNIYPKTEPDAI